MIFLQPHIVVKDAHLPAPPSRRAEKAEPGQAEDSLEGLTSLGITIEVDNSSSLPDSSVDKDAVRSTVSARLKEIGIHTVTSDEWSKYNDAHPTTPMPYLAVTIFLMPGDDDQTLHDQVSIDLMEYVVLARDESDVFENVVWGDLQQSYIPSRGLGRITQDADLAMVWFQSSFLKHNPDVRPSSTP